jgi:dTDP-4-amino-4,6-dideoxygalactose transaminase
VNAVRAVLSVSGTRSAVTSCRLVGLLQRGSPTPPPVPVEDRRIEAALTTRTGAIVPVHPHGHPVDLEKADAVADRHGLAMVEDAAQGARGPYRGRRIGQRCADVSFYLGKNLGALGSTSTTTGPSPGAAAAEQRPELRN